MDLKMDTNKIILVTGGSKGIGADIVKTLANDGYQVVLNYNKSEIEAKKTQCELEQKHIYIDIFRHF